MGEPKFSRPKFTHLLTHGRLQELKKSTELSFNGLKNMREIWKAKSELRRYRRQAMRLIGMVDTTEGHGKREMEDLLASLNNKGLISSDAILDDILSLGTEDILNRRLQAQVYYKGLATTIKQASGQLVNHGILCIGDQKVTIPSYPVSRDEEEQIRYHPSSELNNPEHPIRKAIEGRKEMAEYNVEEADPEATPEFAEEVKNAAEQAPSVDDGGEQ